MIVLIFRIEETSRHLIRIYRKEDVARKTPRSKPNPPHFYRT
jgi:hypothetical protein